MSTNWGRCTARRGRITAVGVPRAVGHQPVRVRRGTDGQVRQPGTWQSLGCVSSGSGPSRGPPTRRPWSSSTRSPWTAPSSTSTTRSDLVDPSAVSGMDTRAAVWHISSPSSGGWRSRNRSCQATVLVLVSRHVFVNRWFTNTVLPSGQVTSASHRILSASGHRRGPGRLLQRQQGMRQGRDGAVTRIRPMRAPTAFTRLITLVTGRH